MLEYNVRPVQFNMCLYVTGEQLVTEYCLIQLLLLVDQQTSYISYAMEARVASCRYYYMEFAQEHSP